jgi:hypothetical protein
MHEIAKIENQELTNRKEPELQETINKNANKEILDIEELEVEKEPGVVEQTEAEADLEDMAAEVFGEEAADDEGPGF